MLYFLAYLGYGAWPLIFVFLAPLWGGLEETRDRGPGVSALVGFVFGLAAFAGGFPWLWRIVDVFLGGDRLLGAILWLAYASWFAAGFAVYALVYRRIRVRGWPVALAGVPSLIAIEWLQPQLFTVNAGSALVLAPAWVQIADLGGPLLLTAVAGAGNVAAFATWEWWRGRRSRPVGTWLACGTIASAVLAYGWARIATVEVAIASAPRIRVGIVQANLGLIEKRTQGVITHQRHLEQTRELLADGPLDLVVWPETAYVRGLRRPLPISGRLVVDDSAVPLLFGGTSVSEEGGRRIKSNSVFLVGSDGMIRDAYDKNLLIPLAESVPFAESSSTLREWFPHAQEFVASSETPALRLGPWRLSTPICYEAIRPAFVRRMVASGRPHLLVTLANDAWFGDSQEPWLHLDLARLRAVEHRRFLVRATNSGVSAIVDPAGRIVARTELLARENLRATVAPMDGETVYGRFGDWCGWLAAALVAVAALGPSRRSEGPR